MFVFLSLASCAKFVFVTLVCLIWISLILVRFLGLDLFVLFAFAWVLLWSWVGGLIGCCGYWFCLVCCFTSLTCVLYCFGLLHFPMGVYFEFYFVDSIYLFRLRAGWVLPLSLVF